MIFRHRALARALGREKNLSFAYVYGSILTRRDAGDMDIALYLAGSGDCRAAAQETAARLEKALDYACRVDAHPLNGAAPSFAFEVMRTGRVIFERKKRDRLDWEARALSRYQYIRPMLDFHDRRFIAK